MAISALYPYSLSSASVDGWINPGETWTYTSSTSFTEAGDSTSLYSIGDKIKLTQSGSTKYFFVTSVELSVGNTVVGITGGSDYSLASADITENYYSKSTTPSGFPTRFNYSPSFSGFSVSPSNIVATFFLVGRVCTTHIRCATGGTSNSTALTVTAPVTARTLTNGFWIGVAACQDNGSNVTTPSRMTILSAATSFVFTPTFAGGSAWTSSAGKNVISAEISYEI